jgi:hypothetical protein
MPHDDRDRSEARREAATLLGVDVEHLSPADGLRVDMVSALRLVIDAEQATVLSGGSADLAKLNIAVQSLIALLPNRELPEPAPVDGGPNDPRTIMWENYCDMRRRAVPAISEHGNLVDSLRASLIGLAEEIEQANAPASVGDTATPAPPAPSNVVPLSRTPAAPAAQPVPQPPRPCRIGETWSPERGFQPIPPKPNDPPAAAASTPRTVAPAPSFNYDDAMRYVLPDGSISPTPVGGRWDA